MAVSGIQWRSMTASGCQWQSVTVSGCQWQSVAVSGCQWQSVAVSGCQWQSFFYGDILLVHHLCHQLTHFLITHYPPDTSVKHFVSMTSSTGLSRKKWSSRVQQLYVFCKLRRHIPPTLIYFAWLREFKNFISWKFDWALIRYLNSSLIMWDFSSLCVSLKKIASLICIQIVSSKNVVWPNKLITKSPSIIAGQLPIYHGLVVNVECVSFNSSQTICSDPSLGVN